jgi:hypothetical protein
VAARPGRSKTAHAVGALHAQGDERMHLREPQRLLLRQPRRNAIAVLHQPRALHARLGHRARLYALAHLVKERVVERRIACDAKFLQRLDLAAHRLSVEPRRARHLAHSLLRLKPANHLTHFGQRQLPEAHRHLLREAPRIGGQESRSFHASVARLGPLGSRVVGWSHDPENSRPCPSRGGPMTLKNRWSLQAENLSPEVVPSG